MITASVCGGDAACITQSLDVLGRSDAAARAAAYAGASASSGSSSDGGGWPDAGGAPSSSGFASGSEGDANGGSSGSGGEYGSNGWPENSQEGGGAGNAWDAQRARLEGSWQADSDGGGRGNGGGGGGAAGRPRGGGGQPQAELALDLDSWQQIGFPNAVLAAVVACKSGVKRAHLIDADSDGCALLLDQSPRHCWGGRLGACCCSGAAAGRGPPARPSRACAFPLCHSALLLGTHPLW